MDSKAGQTLQLGWPTALERSRASKGRIFVCLVYLLVFSWSSIAEEWNSIKDPFYNPGDSTIYFTVWGGNVDGSTYSMVFRLKDQGSRIEMVYPQVDQIVPGLRFILIEGHDNRSDVLYGYGWAIDEAERTYTYRLITYDGGEYWQLSPGPDCEYPSGLNYPGENPGQSYRLRNGLHYTQNGWETWVSDTSITRGWWGDHSEFTVHLGRRIGHLARFLSSERTNLQYSSDTGRTWVDGDLRGAQVPYNMPYFIPLGRENEFYGYTREGDFCVRDSGRVIQEIFDFRDHNNDRVRYDYVDEGGFGWNSGRLVTTPTPGEFYAIKDSTSWDSWGIKIHVFHCIDYGEDIVGIYYYDLPYFYPSDPEAVFQRGMAPPSIPLLSVYPNPTNGWVTIYYSAAFQTAVLRLYDLTGRLCSTVRIVKNPLQLRLQDALRLPDASGTYILEYQSPQTLNRKTITVTR